MDYSSQWAKAETLQGYIMIASGVVLLILLFFIFRSEQHLLRGTMVPLSLLMLILIGYGGYVTQSRPAHSQASIQLYSSSPEEAVEQEKEKHINDNKAGKMLMRYVYPSLILLSALALLFLSSPYHRGVAIGCNCIGGVHICH